MRTIIRIPTVQFGYMEFQDIELETAQQVIDMHNDLVKMYKESTGGLTVETW